MLNDAYGVVAVQSDCSSTLALLASLVIRLRNHSMLVCTVFVVSTRKGAMRQLMLFAGGCIFSQ